MRGTLERECKNLRKGEFTRKLKKTFCERRMKVKDKNVEKL